MSVIHVPIVASTRTVLAAEKIAVVIVPAQIATERITMRKEDKELLDGKRLELETLFATRFPEKQIEEMADVLWNFAQEKFKGEKVGATYLAFLACVDRTMFYIVAKAQGDSNPGSTVMNPTRKNRIILPEN